MSVPRYAGSICGSEQSSSTRWIFPFAFPIHAPTRVPRGLWGCAGPATHQYSREPMPQVRPRSSRGEPPRINSQPCLLRRLTRSCSSSDSERFRVRHLQSGSLSIEVRARIISSAQCLIFLEISTNDPCATLSGAGEASARFNARTQISTDRKNCAQAVLARFFESLAMLLPRLVGIILGVERGEGYWRSLVR